MASARQRRRRGERQRSHVRSRAVPLRVVVGGMVVADAPRLERLYTQLAGMSLTGHRFDDVWAPWVERAVACFAAADRVQARGAFFEAAGIYRREYDKPVEARG